VQAGLNEGVSHEARNKVIAAKVGAAAGAACGLGLSMAVSALIPAIGTGFLGAALLGYQGPA